MAFPTDLLCILTGLPEDTGLEGSRVRIVKWEEDLKRYYVSIPGDRSLAVLESRLRVLEDGEAVEIAGSGDPELDGKRGEISQFVPNYGKYSVSLDARTQILVANAALHFPKASRRDVADMTAFLKSRYIAGFASAEVVSDVMDDYGEFVGKPRRNEDHPWSTYRVDLTFDEEGSRGMLRCLRRRANVFTLDVFFQQDEEYEVKLSLDFVSDCRATMSCTKDRKVVATLVILDPAEDLVMLEGFTLEREDGSEERVRPLYLKSGRSFADVDEAWSSQIRSMVKARPQSLEAAEGYSQDAGLSAPDPSSAEDAGDVAIVAPTSPPHAMHDEDPPAPVPPPPALDPKQPPACTSAAIPTAVRAVKVVKAAPVSAASTPSSRVQLEPLPDANARAAGATAVKAVKVVKAAPGAATPTARVRTQLEPLSDPQSLRPPVESTALKVPSATVAALPSNTSTPMSRKDSKQKLEPLRSPPNLPQADVASRPGTGAQAMPPDILADLDFDVDM
eukprot:TRINITY_DN77571_c0_g1_i1.p1 TRINITY_DN77571_c0_g1~~TRINITY_DN77571_c0_g1_i1.p1  ORF type:complete len:514 (-),score=97.06 TRINITY_DN77571_c0_g1_i1:4-1518(-)